MIDEEKLILPYLSFEQGRDGDNDDPSPQPQPTPQALWMAGKTCFYCGKENHIAGSDKKPICKTKIADRKKGIIRRFIPGVPQPPKRRPTPAEGGSPDAEGQMMRLLGDPQVRVVDSSSSSNGPSFFRISLRYH